jgi:uracil-DNA glycosylase
MMPTDEALSLLTRYLRQQRELGGSELVLDRIAPGELVSQLSPRAPVSTGLATRAPAAASTIVSAPTASPTAGAPLVQLGSLDALREAALACERCGLAGTRTNVVFGEGSLQARLVVVGEAPGADEDASGRPFVGRAGKLLNLLLAAVGFERDSVYICNVLKCRPPGNRNPQPEEVEACSGFLRQQLAQVAPKVVLACGTFAAQTLVGTREPIGRLRGGQHEFEGIPLVPTYHPAALLRNPAWVRPVWEDLQRVRSVLGDA